MRLPHVCDDSGRALTLLEPEEVGPSDLYIVDYFDASAELYDPYDDVFDLELRERRARRPFRLSP